MRIESIQRISTKEFRTIAKWERTPSTAVCNGLFRCVKLSMENSAMGSSKNRMIVLGAIIALAGVLAIAIPVFTTEQTHDVAKVGDLKLTAKEQTSHVIPPYVGPVVLAVGVVLIGAGFLSRR